LQRQFFRPPTEGRARWGIERELRPTKFKDGPPMRWPRCALPQAFTIQAIPNRRCPTLA
jgi:hypothetical protein